MYIVVGFNTTRPQHVGGGNFLALILCGEFRKMPNPFAHFTWKVTLFPIRDQPAKLVGHFGKMVAGIGRRCYGWEECVCDVGWWLTILLKTNYILTSNEAVQQRKHFVYLAVMADNVRESLYQAAGNLSTYGGTTFTPLDCCSGLTVIIPTQESRNVWRSPTLLMTTHITTILGGQFGGGGIVTQHRHIRCHGHTGLGDLDLFPFPRFPQYLFFWNCYLLPLF